MILMCRKEEGSDQTFKEFKKKFYPNSMKKRIEDIDDPKELGRELAKRSIEKAEKYFKRQ